jgi:DNA-binding NarL/FixJ family response regulator
MVAVDDPAAARSALGTIEASGREALVDLRPTITRRLIEEFVRPRPQLPLSATLDQLSPRESEVFRLMARGRQRTPKTDPLWFREV